MDFVVRVGSGWAWTDLFPVALIAVACWHMRFAPRGQFFETPLDKERGLAWRGLFAIVVVLHHVTAAMPMPGLLFPCFRFLGRLAVAVFFGLSGYGLAVQVLGHRNYVDTFWGKRLSSLWPPYLVMAVLCILQLLRDGGGSLATLWIDQLGFVRFGWFCTVLLALYAVFWVVFRFLPDGGFLNVVRVAVGVSAVSTVFFFLSGNPIVAASNGAFVAGMLLGCCGHGLAAALRRWSWGILPPLLLLGALRFLLPSAPSSECRFAASVCVNTLSIVILAALGLKIRLGNRWLYGLGAVSYELYLAHGWVMAEIHHWWPDLAGAPYAWSVVMSSIALACAVHWGVPLFRHRTAIEKTNDKPQMR